MPDGTTHFHLWAPSAPATLALEIEGMAPIPLQPDEAGWARAHVACPAGTRYCYRLDADRTVPDPASRLQADDVHGQSVVTAPGGHAWSTPDWAGRPWDEAVIYEVHAGLAGGFAGLQDRLPDLATLGITVLQLMPIADFPGQRNWGYDGVLPFAPDTCYGTPLQLKKLIDAAHALNMSVMLDVVYNHFGPDGNYLPAYAKEFFRDDIQTPWGPAIDFRRPQVRRYFEENALYWLTEFRFDGLRLDAVHAIANPEWLPQLARYVRSHISAQRHVHLVVENHGNRASLLRDGYDAQWNDDGHHVLHHLLTRETHGYYADYVREPAEMLARCLAEGFVYQGQPTLRNAARLRGEPSADLCPTAFVLFLQNHDQTGNRALGERLRTLVGERQDTLRAAVALQLLAPQIPLIFMGEECGSQAPFLYFTDHRDPALAQAVREGRQREFRFDAGPRGDGSMPLPDPNEYGTYACCYPWTDGPDAQQWLEYYQVLLAVRQRMVVPRLAGIRVEAAYPLGPRAVAAHWRMSDEARLSLYTNLGTEISALPGPLPQVTTALVLFESCPGACGALAAGTLPAACTVCVIEETP
ncbi:malto-oligosyltrehalose trehalohydrolase [Bordetella sp. BOR01]|uniref:malto-oligosyltrehalose trehalohydrolase n=1 Tax=Bordetella sp. BOR01 TaxID=2854779 RepID=UPI001C4868C4|nr:malto-oligosyltrehalose trehalohydrolase [Bordetella sp. BOR01]MBV7486129.1 malto-oligosyltrehalose trehalohydrolase [Bordetella sp. BOR01]